jgi:hypothetical protein
MLFRYQRYLWQQRRKIWAWRTRRRSVSKGFVNGRAVWQALAVALYGRRFLANVLRKKPEVVAVERLAPGQFVSIRTIDPRTERGG